MKKAITKISSFMEICITNEKLDKTGFYMKSNNVDFHYDMDDQV